MKLRTRLPCNLEVKDCPSPLPTPYEIADVAKWGIEKICDVVGGVDYRGGTYVVFKIFRYYFRVAPFSFSV